MISKRNPAKQKRLIAMNGYVLLMLIAALIIGLSMRDSCGNPGYANYGDVHDCPAHR